VRLGIWSMRINPTDCKRHCFTWVGDFWSACDHCGTYPTAEQIEELERRCQEHYSQFGKLPTLAEPKLGVECPQCKHDICVCPEGYALGPNSAAPAG